MKFSIILSLVIFLCRYCSAQEIAGSKANISLTASQASSFRTAIDSVAALAKVAIVAEDQPFVVTLDTSHLQGVILSGSADSVMQSLASAYDYDAVRTGETYVLVKRYRNLYDLPDVTEQECVNFVQNIRHQCSIIESVSSNSLESKNLSNLLTSEEISKAERNNLLVRSLPLPRQKQILSLLLADYLHRTITTEDFDPLNYLNPDDNRVGIGWGNLELSADIVSDLKIPEECLKHQFGCNLYIKTYESENFVPMSGIYAPYFGFGEIHCSASEGYQSLDVTSPSADKTEGKMQQVTTVGSLISQVNAKNKVKIVSIDEINQKHVCVAGIDYATSYEIADGLQKIYGYQSDKPSSKLPELITLHERVTPTLLKADEISDALFTTIPPALCRALHLDEIRTVSARLQRKPQLDEDTDPKSLNSEETLNNLERGMHRRSQDINGASILSADLNRQRDLMSSPSRIRIAAITRLRELVEPQLAAKSVDRIPLSLLGHSEHDAYAALIIAGFLNKMMPLVSNPVPDYIRDFDDVTLGGTPSKEDDGKKFFTLRFFLANRDGNLHPTMGELIIPNEGP